MFIDIGTEISINLSQCVSFQPLNIPAGAQFNNETLKEETFAIQFSTISNGLTIRFEKKEDRDAKLEECRALTNAWRNGMLRAGGTPQVVRPVVGMGKFQ